jgi:hypothetical protein
MSSKFKTQSSKQRENFKFKITGKSLLLLFTFYFLLFTLACSVPNLEKPECTEARQPVKEFYSYHFGNDMNPSKENLQSREKFLTDDLKQQLTSQTEIKQDYFTLTEDYPKAFRIGVCEVIEPNKTVFQILMFWKDDERTEQREVRVEAVKSNGKWLINRIF